MLDHIDHVIMPVRDLEAAVADLSNSLSLFVPDMRGGHPQFGTSNTVIWLDQGYLEIISVTDSTRAPDNPIVQELLRVVDAGEGIMGFALSSTDLRSDVDLLGAMGSSVTAPEPGEWVGEDGRRASWVTSVIPHSVGAPVPFLIQYDERPWSTGTLRDWGDRQPLTIRSVAEVTILADDVDAAASVYKSQLGLNVSRRDGDRVQIGLAHGAINFAPGPGDGGRAGIHSVGLGVTDLTAATNELRARGIAFEDDPLTLSRAVQIDPSRTLGVRLDLVQI